MQPVGGMGRNGCLIAGSSCGAPGFAARLSHQNATPAPAHHSDPYSTSLNALPKGASLATRLVAGVRHLQLPTWYPFLYSCAWRGGG